MQVVSENKIMILLTFSLHIFYGML